MNFSKPAVKTVMMLIFVLLALLLSSCEKIDWRRAVQKNTIPAYQHFMRTHHRSLLLMEASDRLEKLYFAEAKKVDSIPAYEAFTRRYSRGQYADSARFFIEKLAFENAQNANSVPAFQAFLHDYNPLAYADSAYRSLNQLLAQRHPDFRNVKTAHVIVKPSLGEDGNLNAFVDLPFERIIKDIMTKNGILVTFGEAEGSDMLLTVHVSGDIIKRKNHAPNDSLSAYGISFDVHFTAQAQGKEPIVLDSVSDYYPKGQNQTTSIAGSASFESAFWQPGSYPTALTTLLSQCFGPNALISLLDKDKQMRPHIELALATMDGPVSDILYANIEAANEKSMAIASILAQRRDRRVTSFLVDMLHCDDRDFQMQAMRLLKILPDAEGITPLIDLTEERRDRQRRLLAIETLGSIQDEKSVAHLTHLLHDRDEEIRELAVIALGQQKNPNSISALIKAFDDEERQVANQAMTALTQIGDVAIDSLKRALESDNASTVWRAMAVLGELRAEAAVDDIIPLLNHANSFTSWKAREVLGQFKNDHVLQTMMQALQDAEMTEKAAAVLGQIGDAAAVLPLIASYHEEMSHRTKIAIIRALGLLRDSRAVDLLTQVLNSGQIILQTEAARALGKIGDAKSLPALSQWYQKEDLALKTSILEAYGSFQNPKQTQRLAQALKEERNELRVKAVEMLAGLGDPTIIEDLVHLLNDPAQNVQGAAKTALISFGDEAIPSMSRLLKSRADRNLRIKIVHALKDIQSERAVAPLISVLGDPDPYFVNNVKSVVPHFGEAAVRPLLSCRSGNPAQRARAAEILAMMREPRAMPEFINILKGPSSDLKTQAAFLAGELKYYAAVPLLLRCLDAQGTELAVESAIALGKIGSAEATAALIAALESKNTRLAVESARALGHIKDVRAISSLVEKFTSRNELLKKAAGEALVQMGAPAAEPLFSLMTDSDHFTIKDSADILAEIGPPAVPMLTALMHNTSTPSWYAVEALGKIRDQQAIQPLIAALALDDEFFYQNVKRALANIGQPAFEPVIALLQSESAEQRWKAIEVVYAFREPSMIEHFIIALDDDDWRVRYTAARSLQNISGENHGMNAKKWRKWFNERSS